MCGGGVSTRARWRSPGSTTWKGGASFTRWLSPDTQWPVSKPGEVAGLSSGAGLDAGSLALARLDHLEGGVSFTRWLSPDTQWPVSKPGEVAGLSSGAGLDAGSLALARLDHLEGGVSFARWLSPDTRPHQVVEPGHAVAGVETR